jgi:hypothetical protein
MMIPFIWPYFGSLFHISRQVKANNLSLLSMWHERGPEEFAGETTHFLVFDACPLLPECDKNLLRDEYFQTTIAS